MLEEEAQKSFPLYQCRTCGTSFEMFGGGKYATFYPEWATERINGAKETVEFAPRQSKSKMPQRVLGRGLREIQASQKSSGGRGLEALFGGVINHGKAED